MSTTNKVPVPVSVQIYNLFPGHYNRPDETVLRNPRLDYSTQLLRPVRADIVDVPCAANNNKSDADEPTKETTTILYSFPLEDTTCRSVSPSWAHLSEALNWEALDRQSFDRIHMRFRLESASRGRDEGGGDDEDNSLGPYFLQIPLHPCKLIPLQRDLPPNRPINTALVQFSDESFRITAHVLEQMKHETPAVADEKLLRFEEDAFRTLDSVVASTPSPSSSLLDAAEEFEAGGLAIRATSTEELSVEVVPSPASAKPLLEQVSHLPSERNAEILELQRKRDAWLERIKAEQDALDTSKRAWHADRVNLHETLQALLTRQERIQHVHKATREEEVECQRLELHLEAQRIRLIKELRQIYPVAGSDGIPRVWRIRGLVLPPDLFSVGEDDLSAVLGFLCHVVALLSRYLSVPLRYRLYCNSSRSAVQDDRGTVFPLFQARPVEREQVEAGVILLKRNVECIGLSRGIRWGSGEKPVLHILEKVKTIYENVINGDAENSQ